jgi:hypothetical protein
MSTHIEQPSYGDLLDTVRGLQRYARAARQYLPLHLGTNLVELSTAAMDLVLRAEVVEEGETFQDFADYEEARG